MRKTSDGASNGYWRCFVGTRAKIVEIVTVVASRRQVWQADVACTELVQ